MKAIPVCTCGQCVDCLKAEVAWLDEQLARARQIALQGLASPDPHGALHQVASHCRSTRRATTSAKNEGSDG